VERGKPGRWEDRKRGRGEDRRQITEGEKTKIVNEKRKAG
jgi:hypothetical protein